MYVHEIHYYNDIKCTKITETNIIIKPLKNNTF